MAIKGSLKEASLPDVLQLLSMGKNTPLEGRDLRGRVLLTLAAGRIVHENWFAVSR